MDYYTITRKACVGVQNAPGFNGQRDLQLKKVRSEILGKTPASNNRVEKTGATGYRACEFRRYRQLVTHVRIVAHRDSGFRCHLQGVGEPPVHHGITRRR